MLQFNAEWFITKRSRPTIYDRKGILRRAVIGGEGK